jgi:hypothetical protein
MRRHGKLAMIAGFCGDAALCGFEDPVRLFEVRWREEGS